MATVRIIDMECSVPRGATDEHEAASAPPRAPEAGRADRPAGEDHRPDTDLDAFMEMLAKVGVERALPFGVDNDEMSALLRAYPGRFIGLARISAFKGMGGVRELERRVREE